MKNKKRFVALIMVGIMCVISNTVLVGAYQGELATVLNNNIVYSGEVFTPTTFRGNTTWNESGAQVQTQATTYSRVPGSTGDGVAVECGSTGIKNNVAIIDQTASGFTMLGYTISKVQFVHWAYHQSLVKSVNFTGEDYY